MGSKCRMQMETSSKYLLGVVTAELCHSRNEDKITYFAVNPSDANIWQWKQSKFLLSTKLWRNPVAADSKRPGIMSLAFPVKPFLNILVRRSQEASRRQYKVPKSLSVQPVPACLSISMWTFFVSVATSLCCDLNGKKIDNIFLRVFSFLQSWLHFLQIPELWISLRKQ